MNVRLKRGLSPVVATVLLISLALILALIVFLWAKTFIGEKTEKAGRAIELICDEVDFRADAYLIEEGSTLVIDIQNDGAVPLYGLEIKKKKGGVIKNVVSKVFDKSLGGGRTGNMTIKSTDVGGEFPGSTDTLIIAPTLLGKQKDARKPYTCEKNVQEVIVGVG